MTSSTATRGISAGPKSVTWKANKANATIDTVVMAMANLPSPNNTTPPMYSLSRSGVTNRLSRLRSQVSSMKPVERLISAWNTTWNSRMPASSAPMAACPPSDARASCTPSAPNRMVSTMGQKTTSNHRCGARCST